MGKRMVKRLLALGAVSFSCLCLSVMSLNKGSAQISSDAKITSYIQELKDNNANIRSAAAAMLGGVIGAKAKAVVPALIEALKDNDAAVRSNAASALRSIGVTTCNTNRSNLQSRHLQTRIICNYNCASARKLSFSKALSLFAINPGRNG